MDQEIRMDLLDLAREAGLNPKKTASTHGGEYHSACPNSSCPDSGGKDRFIIWPNKPAKNCVGQYMCRQCGKNGHPTSGDTIQFCIEFLNMDFRSAVEYLRISLPETTLISDWRSCPAPATLTPPNSVWIARAEEIVSIGEHYIQKNRPILEMLAARGLPEEAVRRYRIGYLPESIMDERTLWGLPSSKDEEGQEKKLWLPRGILIPSFDGGKVVRIKVRRTDWTSRDKVGKYIRLSGGMNGLNIVGDLKKKAMVVVESELDALALHWAAPDLIVAVSVGSNTANPDNVVDRWARKCPNLLVCYDNDDAGLAMWKKWERLYPNAVPFPTPVGKDVGEAVQVGLDLRTWIINRIGV